MQLPPGSADTWNPAIRKMAKNRIMTVFIISDSLGSKVYAIISTSRMVEIIAYTLLPKESEIMKTVIILFFAIFLMAGFHVSAEPGGSCIPGAYLVEEGSGAWSIWTVSKDG